VVDIQIPERRPEMLEIKRRPDSIEDEVPPRIILGRIRMVLGEH